MAPVEVQVLLAVCRKKAQTDVANGRKIWVIRHLIVHLACGSGLRAGEIAGLRIRDLRLEADPPCLVVVKPEGRRTREVHLGRRLAEHLASFLNLRATALREPLDGEDLLLPGRGGRPYTGAALGVNFRKAVQAARLSPRYSLRNARHTYSFLLLAKTGDLRYVQGQMGHVNQSMTCLYQGLALEVQAKLINDLLG
jgi:site-specific recombinase XerC